LRLIDPASERLGRMEEPLAESLPLDRCRRLSRDVVHDAIDSAHFIDNPVRDARQHLVRNRRPVRGHEVGRITSSLTVTYAKLRALPQFLANCMALLELFSSDLGIALKIRGGSQMVKRRERLPSQSYSLSPLL